VCDDASIVEITAAKTHDLRRRVLRTGTVSTDVVFDGDEDPGTTHLAAVRGSAVVAIVTMLPNPFPDEPQTPALQLRGMATDPGVRGAGLGMRLVTACEERARDQNIVLIWARARTSAVGFYLHAGFETHGTEFDDRTTGLPHRLIVKRLR
jgi:GNAT superfamily N-acetyltransferase